MEHSKQKNSRPKLKAFKTTQKMYAMIGINRELLTQSYPFNGRIFTGFLVLSMAIAFLSVYIFTDAETFSEYTQSIYIASAAVAVGFGLAIAILKVDKLFEYINCCDCMLNMTSDSIRYETNRFEEKLSKIIFFVMINTPACLFVPWCLYIAFNYFVAGLGNEAFELPQPMWLPFDFKNPVGFLIAITMQYTAITHGIEIAASNINLAIGSYLYAIALSKIIKRSLFTVDRSTQFKTDRSILLKQFTEFLELHSTAKQVISRFSDIFQYFITLVFVWSLVTICGAMLMIQIQLTHRDDNFVVLLITLFEVFYAFSLLFIACELGQRFNLAFVECSEIVDQFDWYLFPTKIQRMLPMILNFTQQPFEIVCFGSKACDRDTFKSVMKTAFTYFSILRKIYN